jgi:hypothetical protein
VKEEDGSVSLNFGFSSVLEEVDIGWGEIAENDELNGNAEKEGR